MMNEKLSTEIHVWLDRQHWKNEFAANIRRTSGKTLEEYTGSVISKWNANSLISGAFNWATSPEGPSKWAKRNNDYLLWLEGETH